MDDDVIRLVDKTGNADMWSIKDALEEAIKDTSPGGENENVTDVMVIMLDRSDGRYDVSFTQSAMSASEMVALLSVMTAELHRKMGY